MTDMTREEAADYLIRPVASSTLPGEEYVKQLIAWGMAVRALRGELKAEPKHGRWEYTDYGGVGNWHCSECHNIVVGINGFPNLTQYCPNCGARMDEVEE